MTDLTHLHSILLFAAATALLFAAAHDVAVRTVPNLAPLFVAVAGLGLQILDRQLVPALFGTVLVFAGTWQCWRRGWIGGGDVKLLSACALLVPPTLVPELILATAMAGGVLALFYLALALVLPAGVLPAGVLPAGATQLPTSLIGRIWRTEQRRIRRRLSLPYACAISAGVLLTLNVTVPLG